MVCFVTVIPVRKFICPLCSEVTISSYERIMCPVCGERMTQMTDCLLVSLPDRPGALAEFSEQIAQRGININALRVIGREDSSVLVLFSVDRLEEALALPGVKRADDLPIPFQRTSTSPQE